MLKKISKIPFSGTKEQEEKLKQVIAECAGDNSQLMHVMQVAQDIYGYLPFEVQQMIADGMGVPLEKVYGVATFYENFSLEPKGTNIIRCCDGTACHVRHSTEVLDYLRKELGLSATKRTTDDLKFTVETVSCLGACGLAPVITVNGKVYSQMTKEKAAEVLKELREEN